mmetsp:Transcript_5536/g.13506  ORF Transcript_5536/g.13506 Transcript_5536/m.13506 type:complete len:294 (+) Transcript_5536:85-966(+)
MPSSSYGTALNTLARTSRLSNELPICKLAKLWSHRMPLLRRRREHITSQRFGSASIGQESPFDSYSESEKEGTEQRSRAANHNTEGLKETKRLVEVAMLAAMTGLAYFLASVVKLEGYLGYFLPLPVVMAAMRWSPSTGWRTVAATCCLIMVLLGPVRMLTYLLMHGFLAGTMGVVWARRLPWATGVLAGAAVRTVGQIGYLAVSSWMMNENLFALLMSNVFSLLDRILVAAGSAMVPTTGALLGVSVLLLLINGVIYMFLLNVLYFLLLQRMGYETAMPPERLRRMLQAGGR